MKKYYEFLGIIPGSLAENEVEPVIKRITDFFTSQKAEIAYSENLGRRKIAYPIKHLRYGYYLLLEFYFEGSFEEIKRKLKIDDGLLRYLITTTKPKTREEREKEKVKQQQEQDKDKRKSKRTEEPTTKSKDKKSSDEGGKVSMDELNAKLDEIIDDKI